MAWAFSEPTAEVASSSDTNSYPLGSFTPSANAILIVFVEATDTAAAGTMSGGGLTWTRRGSVVYNSVNKLYVFTAETSASPSSCTPTFDCTGDNATGTVMAVLQFTGGDTSSSFVQVASNSGNDDNPTITFGSARNTNNAYAAMVGYDNTGEDSGPPSGWTRSFSTNYNTPTQEAFGGYRLGGETATGLSWPISNTENWGMIGIEIKVLSTSAISGTADLVFGSGSSTLTGSGSLAGTATLTFGAGSSTLIASGSLTGTATLTFGAGSSTLTGKSGAAGTSTLSFFSLSLLGAISPLAGVAHIAFGPVQAEVITPIDILIEIQTPTIQLGTLNLTPTIIDIGIEVLSPDVETTVGYVDISIEILTPTLYYPIQIEPDTIDIAIEILNFNTVITPPALDVAIEIQSPQTPDFSITPDAIDLFIEIQDSVFFATGYFFCVDAGFVTEAMRDESGFIQDGIVQAGKINCGE